MSVAASAVNEFSGNGAFEKVQNCSLRKADFRDTSRTGKFGVITEPLISLRLPDHVIEDLKEVAPSLGFGGYQALIRAYISNGLRKHLAEREAQWAKDSHRRGVQPEAHGS